MIVLGLDSKRSEVCEDVAKFFNLEVISPDTLVENELEKGSELSKQIVTERERFGKISDELLYKIVRNGIKYIENSGKRWLLENFP